MPDNSPNSSDVVTRFKALFNSVEPGALPDLASVYRSDIHFQDPFTDIRGIDGLSDYFGNAYCNVLYCRFEFAGTMTTGDQLALPWVMNLKHKKLAGGELVRVQGMSHLKIRQDRVIYHRDYFDAGQLLYENVPVLGSAVRFLRRYAA